MKDLPLARRNFSSLLTIGTGVSGASGGSGKARAAGNLDAQVEAGNMYYCSDYNNEVPQDEEQAAILWENAAIRGHKEAQYLAATLVVTLPQAKSMKYLRMSARQGHTPALCELGQMYAEGNGVKEDLKMAFDFYKAAAKAGDTSANVQADKILAKIVARKNNTYRQYQLACAWEASCLSSRD